MEAMRSKPRNKLIACNSGDVSARWRYLHRDLLFCLPFAEGAGLKVRDIVQDRLLDFEGAAAGADDWIFGRAGLGLRFTFGGGVANTYIRVDDCPFDVPMTDWSSLIVHDGGNVSSVASSIMCPINDADTTARGWVVNGEVYNDTGHAGLTMYGGTSVELSLASEANLVRSRVDTVRLGATRYDFRSSDVGHSLDNVVTAPTSFTTRAVCVGGEAYRNDRIGWYGHTGRILLAALWRHPLPAGAADALVRDPWSWITRRRVFAVGAPAAAPTTASLQHIYRHVAGIGA